MAGLGATHWDCLILDLTFASLKLLDGNKKKDRGPEIPGREVHP